MQLIQTITVTGSTTSSMSFTNIPQTATDLLILGSLRQNAGDIADQIEITLNSSSSSIFDYIQLRGTGSSAASTGRASQRIWEVYGAGNTAPSNTFASLSLYLPNYANTSFNKKGFVDVVNENSGTEAWQTLLAGGWNSTSAVTSVQLNTRDVSLYFTVGSTASLYTITKA